MASFFATLNFPRGVILVSVVASLGLGWLVYDKGRDLALMREQSESGVVNAVRMVQSLSLQLNQLQAAADKEGFKQQDNPELYIRGVAQQDGVNIAQVNIDPSSNEPAKGVVDQRYMIKPSDKNRTFSRINISNFLYRLEEKSRRVRVTHLKIEPPGKVKPEEPVPDQWSFEVQITSRQADEKAEKKDENRGG